LLFSTAPIAVLGHTQHPGHESEHSPLSSAGLPLLFSRHGAFTSLYQNIMKSLIVFYLLQILFIKTGYFGG
jgi:hypothetical protein